jgi:hypothetical protein
MTAPRHLRPSGVDVSWNVHPENNDDKEPSTNPLPGAGKENLWASYRHPAMDATVPPSDADGNGNLSHNQVDTEITPDVKANHVAVYLCSCSFIWNCFSNSNGNA